MCISVFNFLVFSLSFLFLFDGFFPDFFGVGVSGENGETDWNSSASLDASSPVSHSSATSVELHWSSDCVGVVVLREGERTSSLICACVLQSFGRAPLLVAAAWSRDANPGFLAALSRASRPGGGGACLIGACAPSASITFFSGQPLLMWPVCLQVLQFTLFVHWDEWCPVSRHLEHVVTRSGCPMWKTLARNKLATTIEWGRGWEGGSIKRTLSLFRQSISSPFTRNFCRMISHLTWHFSFSRVDLISSSPTESGISLTRTRVRCSFFFFGVRIGVIHRYGGVHYH